MREQAQRLAQVVSVFRLGNESVAAPVNPPEPPRRPAPVAARKPAPTALTQPRPTSRAAVAAPKAAAPRALTSAPAGRSAAGGDEKDWETF
jgi:hypothetical protein